MTSPETENQLLRSVLSLYAGGDNGGPARFALDDTDTAVQAFDAYQAQQARVVEAAVAFLRGDSADTGPLQREIDAILRLRGQDSHKRCASHDVRRRRRTS